MEHWGVILFIILGIVLWGAISSHIQKRREEEERARRKAYLLDKYGNDSSVVEDIANGLIRQGMTYEMVIDAWGAPAAVDKKVYRTKIKETLKYGPGPRRSFSNRVVIENGVVVGWEQR